ncbi:MAG: restriction endonuclease subunit [Verrucomicrobiales bacterium]|nr:restriction endonuclease subunit [Verrucomicrobiales bacterium]
MASSRRMQREYFTPSKMAKTANNNLATTAQSLGGLLKSARDIMRKDKGLNGDLDRLPMLTWIMFLKFLDDLELQREGEAKLSGKKFRPAIEPPYRWRDWAANPQGVTGDELLAFINQDECTLPTGKRGQGLFAYLRKLTSANGDDRREVVATVFRGVQNRMISGYLLRDVINKVAGIHFTSSDELHTLGSLYESMLREMRDAAGDSGEFYTPRAVVRFMVEVTNPRLGETVLDPACGTGGFLVEVFNHLSKQVKTVADRKVLQEKSLFGCEAKSLPYLLSQMNLLLHGLDSPQIDPGNSLRFKLADIGEKDRVDLILTNPPFGGEEEKGIQGNFPEDKQTSETALLFLQLIMRKLRRQSGNGRAAVVVPNGTLYEDGVPQRIRQELLTEFNLHTVLRFPKGVFEPYTDIATNVLFFDRSGPTQKVWFYEHPLPPRRAHLKGKSYSATDGVHYEEFTPLLEWWNKRRPTAQAWSVTTETLGENIFDLAQNHPRHANVDLQTPSEIICNVRRMKDESETVMRELEETLSSLTAVSAPGTQLRELLKPREDGIRIQDDTIYTRPRVQLHFRGAKVRDRVAGSEIGSKLQTLIRTNDLLLSRIDARNGAMALVPSELEGAIATNDFPVFEIRSELILPAYLRYCLFQPSMLRVYEHLSRGSTNRRRLNVEKFLDLKIPVPSDLDMQLKVADTLRKAEEGIGTLHEHFGGMEEELEDLVGSALHYVFRKQQSK